MAIDANKGCPEDTLRRLKAASYERFHIELIKSIERLLEDFEMDWDDLAGKLQWKWNEYHNPIRYLTGDEVKAAIGGNGFRIMDMEAINAIAHVFSMEPYILFKPRFPYTLS